MTIKIQELICNVTIEDGGRHAANCQCGSCAAPNYRDPSVIKQLGDRVYRLMRDELLTRGELI